MTATTRTPPVSIRFTEADRRQIVHDAAASGLSTGAYIRACCLKTRRSAIDLVELRDCMKDMGRMSLNLHGLYRIASLGEIPCEAELAAACAEHREMLSRLMIALGKQG